jgi:hypothetical protein
MTTSVESICEAEDRRIMNALHEKAEALPETEPEPETATVLKFWAHDPNTPNGTKGHPRTLIAFTVKNNTITYAAVTWNPVEKFDRQHALRRVLGRLQCPKRQRNIPLVADLGAHKTILKDIIGRDLQNGRTDTYRYRACNYTQQFQPFAS